MKTFRSVSALAVIAALLLCLSACAKSNDGPPDPGTPEPAPLDGTFVCELGTLVFNGDGKSVTVDFSGEMEEIIPDGEMTYYFKWDNFGLCRYDVASVFQLSGGEKNYEFAVTAASDTKIPLVYRTDSKEYTLDLVKEG